MPLPSGVRQPSAPLAGDARSAVVSPLPAAEDVDQSLIGRSQDRRAAATAAGRARALGVSRLAGRARGRAVFASLWKCNALRLALRMGGSA